MNARQIISARYPPARQRETFVRKGVEYISDAHPGRWIGEIEYRLQTVGLHDIIKPEADVTARHGVRRYTGFLRVSVASSEEFDASVVFIEQAVIHVSCETHLRVGQRA